MSNALASAAARPGPSRFERLSRVYHSEIYPLFDHWFTDPLCVHAEALPVKGARVLDASVGAGDLSAALLAQSPKLLVAMDPSGSMLNLAMDHQALQTDVSFAKGGGAGCPLPFVTASFDRVFARARADGVDPFAFASELLRVCARGGQVAFTTATHGTWAEPLDLLNEALERRGEQAARAALTSYQERFAKAEVLPARMQELGLTDVAVSIERKQVLFRSGREFFFSSLVDLGPLRLWKALVGKGEPLQAAFAAVKDAIDTYYSGRPFTVTACVATVTGIRKS